MGVSEVESTNTSFLCESARTVARNCFMRLRLQCKQPAKHTCEEVEYDGALGISPINMGGVEEEEEEEIEEKEEYGEEEAREDERRGVTARGPRNACSGTCAV